MEKLKESLENLHLELKKAKQVDEESIQTLKALLDDIQKILIVNKKASYKYKHKLLNGLKETAQKFEVTHPELSGAINIVIASLSNIGV